MCFSVALVKFIIIIPQYCNYNLWNEATKLRKDFWSYNILDWNISKFVEFRISFLFVGVYDGIVEEVFSRIKCESFKISVSSKFSLFSIKRMISSDVAILPLMCIESRLYFLDILLDIYCFAIALIVISLLSFP